MKICHVISGFGVGGAERLVTDLYSSVHHDHEIEIEVVILKFRKNHVITSRDHIVFDFTKQTINNFLRFKRYIFDNKFDIIHAHMYHALILTLVFRFWFKIVFTAHNTNLSPNKPSLFFNKYLREGVLFILRPIRSADVILGKSREFWQKNNSYCIPNGIMKRNVSTIKRNVFTIINVGRLVPQKNQIDLLKVFAEIREFLNINLVIVGDGPERDNLLNFIENKELSKFVEFIDHAEDVQGLISECHLFVLTSRWEGLPMVLIESAMVGTPIISTDVGSIKDFLGINGLCVDQLKIKSSIIEVFNDYDEYALRARDFSLFVSKYYSIENNRRMHYELYKKILCVE